MGLQFFEIAWKFILSLSIVMLPVWIGQRYGIWAKKRGIEINEGPVGTAANATLGLLAFMLAFTFELVGNRFDKRKELLAQEVSDIRNVYLNAGLVPDPIRTKTRSAIISYVDLRIELIDDPSKFELVKNKSKQLLDTMWSYSEALAAQDRSSEAYSLFMSSVSNLVSSVGERHTVIFYNRLPRAIIAVLMFVTFFSMLVFGYQFGISGKINLWLIFLMAISFAAVMWLIFALDQPEAGLIVVDQSPLIKLHEALHAR